MLRTLLIENLVLIERAELHFDGGLTILSGETGAGKSAILKAIGLVMGEKCDPQLLRSGAERGHVEALFDLEEGSRAILEEAGIPADDELLIRREIHAKGRSRTYINHCMAQAQLLERLTTIDLVGQHANQQLMSLPYHRQIVDLFGNVPLAPFQKTFRELRALERKRAELVATESERLRELSNCQRELEELEDAPLDEDETSLTDEHNRLTHAESLLSTTSELLSTVEEQMLPHLRRAVSLLEGAPDGQLTSPLEGTRTAYAELTEVVHSLRSYRSTLSLDPEQLQLLDDRLALLEGLKRKYGPTLPDVATYLEGLHTRIELLQSADQELEQIDAQIAECNSRCDALAATLTAERNRAAATLTTAWLSHLRPLNMKQARIEIRLTPSPRTEWGDETLEIYFAPNVGEGMLPMRSCGSGGELSRLLLALKTALAGLERTPTLIFDEIDANLGGKTASLMGENIKSIATERQVLCITHLPQVARLADAHFQIHKRETDGRTFTHVAPLSDAERRAELTRMLGADSLEEILV
jgi:DNA repair protein RecN (Recombination protein N)